MEKIDLKDVTFLFLVRLDSIERLENTLASVSFINDHFNTNITLLECAELCNSILEKMLPTQVSYQFQKDDDSVLFRTKYLNQMLREVTTDFVSVWDVDVIVPIEQIVQSVSSLRDDSADCVYPYEKLFLDTSPILRKLYLESYDLSLLVNNMRRMHILYQPDPVGGAFFCKREKYIASGGENESFYGWGIEDGERLTNWRIHRYRVKKVTGMLFHLSHPRGGNSNFCNSLEYVIKSRIFVNTSTNELNKK